VRGALAAFAELMTRPPPTEVIRAIRACGGGKSPGHDGVSIDLLKALLPDKPQPPAKESEALLNTVPIADALSEITGLSFLLGRMTDHATKGQIVMIPKGPIDGPLDVTEMRPITLLSEIGKVANRVLASRVTAILSKHPELVHRSQRAFLQNGNVAQCIEALVDVFEDFAEKSEADRKAELFCVSYDLSKAYDSVQEYSLRATLERFEFPESAITYIVSSLWSSTSCVMTAAGPSEPFDVLSSVRQGDPLAPLIFILVLDALHCGLDATHSQKRVEVKGYSMSGEQDSDLDIASLGYADDTATLAASFGDMEVLHGFVRSFFGAHAWRINAKKTKFVVSVDPRTIRPLYSVDGRDAIKPLARTTTFRYLGVLLNMALDWSDELARLERFVWFVHSRIRGLSVSLAPAVDAVCTFLTPKMEAGLALIPLTSANTATMNRWTSMLRDACLNSAHKPVKNISSPGFAAITYMTNFAEHARIVRVAHAYHRLCMRPHFLAPTATARFLASRRPGHHRHNRLAQLMKAGPIVFELNRGALNPDSLIPSPLAAHARNPLDLIRSWKPGEPALMFQAPTRIDNVFTAFTDGSSVPGSDRCGGFAVVICLDGDLRDTRTVRGPVKRSGGNYLAEATAILAALLSVPANADLAIWSDCLSAIQAVEKRNPCEAARLRMAARPVMTCIHRALRTRLALRARTQINHVYSHTESCSVQALGNRKADEQANLARLEAQDTPSKPFLTGEERFTAWIETEGLRWHVIGDIRKEMTSWSRRQTVDSWSTQARQGRTALADPQATVTLCAEIRRLRSSKHLRFAVLALCEWLPSGRYHGRMMRCDIGCNDEWSCSSCSEPGQETSRHVLTCPANEGVLMDAARETAAIVSGYFPSCPSIWTVPAVRANEIARRTLAFGSDDSVVSRCITDVCSSAEWHGRSPRAVAASLTASLAAVPLCRCSSGRCAVHGWDSPRSVTAFIASALRLDCEILGSRLRPGGPRAWLSDDPLDVSSSGSPWVAWEGLFAICAPSWASGPPAVTLLNDICHRALDALWCPRPTRVAIVAPNDLILKCESGPVAAADFSAALPGAARLLVFQNSNAASLAPFDIEALLYALASRAPFPLQGRFREWTTVPPGGARREYLPFPFWTRDSPLFLPPWVARQPDSPAFAAFRKLGAFDSYAGSLGVLPSDVSVALAAVASHSAFPPQDYLRSAEECVAECRLVLFKGAMRAWANSFAAARRWWQVMDMDTLERRDDIGALLVHQRMQTKRVRKYEAGMMRKAVKRELRPPAPASSRVLRQNPRPTATWNYLDFGNVTPRTRRNLDDDYVLL
jgi:hypothetical protein